MKRAPQSFTRPALDRADKLWLAVATGFGAGFTPIAPGTAGTIVAIPLYLGLVRLPWWLQFLTVAAYVAISIHAADRAGRYFGASDDGHIVSDEISGYFVTMLLVPPTLKAVLVGFVLFRVADVVKPWPASHFDKKVHNGLGNVMDDVAAAVWCRAAMALVVWLWP